MRYSQDAGFKLERRNDLTTMAVELSLVECIEQSVSAEVTPSQRRAALEAYNAFKESKDPCVMATALTLCVPQATLCNRGEIVRHGALLLIEHWVRLRWNTFSEIERTQLKTEVLRWIEGATDITQGGPHVKEGICRVTVEIVKREWPQKWPELLPTLFAISERGGMGPTELVLLILLRTAEDVVHLQMLKNAPQRRRDIYQALTDMVPTLFAFFFKILNTFYSLQDANPTVMTARVKLLKSALITLTCYVEFVQLKEFLLDDVFKMLCFLLNDPHLRLQAVNCLCEIAARKFKGPELEQLCLKFLKQEVMTEILSSIGGALGAEDRETSSTFLLALCETLVCLSKQLAAFVLQLTQEFAYPSTFVDLVNAVLQLTQHPSCVVAKLALSAAAPLLKIEQKDARKLSYPSELWISVCRTIQQRLVFNDYPQSAWDFEDSAELRRAYSNFKSELCDLLRSATILHPSVVVNVGLARLNELLQRVVVSEASQGNDTTSCAVTAEEWAGIHRYMDTVCSTIVKESVNLDGTNIHVQLTEAFDQTLSLHLAGGNDLERLSYTASCCSAFSPFIVDNSTRLEKLLGAVFAMGAMEWPGEYRATRSTESREYRKHGTALFVRLCVEHPQQMVKHLQFIQATISHRLTSGTVSALERQHYLEGLTILSNEMNDPVAQSMLLEQLLASDLAFFSTDAAFAQAIQNVQAFASFLGLDSPESFELAVERRAWLTGKLMTITGVLKRCKVVHERHVAFELIIKTCLTPVLKLVWLYKVLFAQLNLIDRDVVQSIVCLNEADKSNLFADNRPSCDFPEPKVPAAQSFFSVLQEMFSQFLITLSYRPEFYALRDDMAYIITSGIEHLPSIKMRLYFHSVIKAFVKNCPEHLLLPKLSSSFVPLMSTVFSLLNGRWQLWTSRAGGDSIQEGSEATLEALVDDQVMYQMSRDLMEVVAYFLIDSSKPPVKVNEDDNPDTVLAVSTFGKQLLSDENASQCAITVAFTALHWGDTATSVKALSLCRAIAFHLVEHGGLTDSRYCSFMFGAFLRSLSIHGDVEEHVSHLLSFGISLYRWLGRTLHVLNNSVTSQTLLREMLLSAGSDEDSIKRFEQSITSGVTVSQRKRKDLFSAAVKGVIKESLSTKGREIIQIENLAPLWKMPTKKRNNTEAVVSLTDLFG